MNRLTKTQKKELFRKVMAIYNSMPNASYDQVSEILNKSELTTSNGLPFDMQRLSTFLTRHKVYKRTPEKKPRKTSSRTSGSLFDETSLNITDILVQNQMILEMKVSDFHKFSLIKMLFNHPNIEV